MATAKTPRIIKPYPRLRLRTGVRRLSTHAIKRSLIRQQRPRLHAKTGRIRTVHDPQSYLESQATQLVRGSLQERIFYKALIDRGFTPDLDFTFQSTQLGGRMELGGMVGDFLIIVPKVIIQVQSIWHLLTLETVRRDEDQALILTSMGYTVLAIWPEDIEDKAALDYWFNRNIMTLWGTSTQGIGAGAGVIDTPYLLTITRQLYEHLENNVDMVLAVARGRV